MVIVDSLSQDSDMTLGRFPALLGFCVGSMVAIVGCGGGTGKVLGPCVAVQGKVTQGGKALAGGTIAFLSMDDKDKGLPVAEGAIDAQGAYTVKTLGKEGAPVGKYRVTVEPGGEDKAQYMQFDGKYRNWRNSPLTIEVTENAPTGAYDFKLDVRKR
jgi:hypothetical protein